MQYSLTLADAITTTGLQAVTPSSMANVVVGAWASIDTGAKQETVQVQNPITATTFTASLSQTHAAGVAIQLVRRYVGRIDQTAIASQISQEMGNTGNSVNIVTAHPTDPDILYCATAQQVFSTTSGSTANASTVWTQITADQPTGANPSSIAIDNAGNAYVLLQGAVTVGSGEFAVTTPLFIVSSGSWVAQACSGLPTSGFSYGKLLTDPIQPGVLYASNGARVYQVTLNRGTWNWQDISENLPGQWIYDLWIGNIGTTNSPKVLLRAAIPTRGVWERDVTAGATSPTIALYVRGNLLDLGWLPRCPDGVPDPYNPTDPGSTQYHYMWRGRQGRCPAARDQFGGPLLPDGSGDPAADHGRHLR